MPSPIIYEQKSPLSGFFSGFGGAFNDALQKGREESKLKQQGTILQQALQNLGPNPSPIQVVNTLAEAQSQGVPIETTNKYGALYSTLQKNQKQPFGPEQQNQMSELFQKFGQDKDTANRNAELWGVLTTGGQTAFANYLVDSIVRGDQTKNSTSSPFGENIKEEVGFNWPEVDIFEDRTPKERSQLKSDLLKENNKQYMDLNTKYRGTEERLMKYQQLERLNDSGELPTGLENLNINWTTGEIRFPKAANEATQQYVKTVYDFMSGAKDTFGARVTNFEIGTFLKRLPTLANTEEGRRVILAQMKSIENLNALYEKSLMDTYDHYGSQKIDRITAEKIAREYRKDDEKQFRKDFEHATQAQEVYEARLLAPEGKIPARSPTGEIVFIFRNKADKAQKKGYELL